MTAPFPQTDDGRYLVTELAEGMKPDSLTVTYEGQRFRLSGYHGVARKSRVRPDILLYNECERIDAE